MSLNRRAPGSLNSRNDDRAAVNVMADALERAAGLDVSPECLRMLVAVGRRVTAFDARRTGRVTGHGRPRPGSH